MREPPCESEAVRAEVPRWRVTAPTARLASGDLPATPILPGAETPFDWAGRVPRLRP